MKDSDPGAQKHLEMRLNEIFSFNLSPLMEEEELEMD